MTYSTIAPKFRQVRRLYSWHTLMGFIEETILLTKRPSLGFKPLSNSEVLMLRFSG
jgi:hypothetical protein